jgi:2-methylisocitrate lyase-like PEP mutase family enzyme
LVRDVALPLNLLAWPGLPAAARLRELGVRRLSAGSRIAEVVLSQTYSLAQAFLGEGRSEPLLAGVLGNPELNRLMRRT